MTIKTKIAALAVAALAVAGGIASTTTRLKPMASTWLGLRCGPASAPPSSAARSPPATPAPYYRSCLVRQYDAFGRYIGTVNSCY